MDVISEDTSPSGGIADDLMLSQWLEKRDDLMREVDRLERMIFQRTSFLQKGAKL